MLLAWVSYRAARAKTDRAWLAVLLATAAVLTLAEIAPFKTIDRRAVELLTPCSSVKELASALRARTAKLSPELGNKQVCFESLRPSWRKIASRVQQAGVAISFYSCGTSATVLFGAHPMRISIAARE